MDKVNLLGIPISALTREQLFLKLENYLKDNGKVRQIITVNSEFLVAAQTDLRFRLIMSTSAINIADGIGVVWAAKYLSKRGSKNYLWNLILSLAQIVSTGLQIVFSPKLIRAIIPEKISGIDFIWEFSDFAARENKKVFLLGGFGDTGEKAAEALKKSFPRLKIVGTYPGSPQEGDSMIEVINNTKPDILFVAFGPVKQEKWIAENRSKLNAKVAIGLGGTFDYLAGKKPLAPRILREIGLEWLFRLITQPYRWKRILKAVPVFVYYCFRYKLICARPLRKNILICAVNDEGQILVVRRKKQRWHNQIVESEKHWQLPQGGVESGEELEQAAIRELKEETGLVKFDILSIVPDAFFYYWPLDLANTLYNSKFKGQDQSIAFVRVPKTEEIHLDDDELGSYKWINPEDIFKTIHPIRHVQINIVMKHYDKIIRGKNQD